MSEQQLTPDWPVLVSLWRKLMTEPQLPFIDRWLKQQFRPPINRGKKHPAPIPAPSLAEQLQLSRCLMEAIGFAQLACALEQGFKAQQAGAAAPDWDAWDLDWHREDIKTLAPNDFWFWVGLRLDWDISQLRVVDAAARCEFFARARPIGENHLSAWSLLWFGLRPQWASMLEERSCSCGWTHQQLQQFIEWQQQMPPLWLRAQQGKTVVELAAQLRGEGVEVAQVDQHLLAKGGKGLANTQAYKSGWVEIQDLASQMIADAVEAKPGQKIWDACAGAGGKSLAIASRLNNKGMLLATDLQAYKLEELKRRAKRAGLFNLRSFTWDAAAPLQLPKEVAQQQGFDWVLVDAPCTASGTWRRNPDARWRFSNSDTRELLAIQKQILQQASFAVRPGGQLVYATCSWQWAENEGQVRDFLTTNPQFKLKRQQLLGAPDYDADTMFVAVLVRASKS